MKDYLIEIIPTEFGTFDVRTCGHVLWSHSNLTAERARNAALELSRKWEQQFGGRAIIKNAAALAASTVATHVDNDDTRALFWN